MDDRKPDMKPAGIKGIRTEKNHLMSIDNRQKVILTGINNVQNFNETEIALETVMGLLTIKGSSLHMSRLNLETGDLVIDGQVDSFVYSEKQDIKTKGAGFLSKLFR